MSSNNNNNNKQKPASNDPKDDSETGESSSDGASRLVGLFAPPLHTIHEAAPPYDENENHPTSNTSQQPASLRGSLLTDLFVPPSDAIASGPSENGSNTQQQQQGTTSSLVGLFAPPPSRETTEASNKPSLVGLFTSPPRKTSASDYSTNGGFHDITTPPFHNMGRLNGETTALLSDSKDDDYYIGSLQDDDNDEEQYRSKNSSNSNPPDEANRAFLAAKALRHTRFQTTKQESRFQRFRKKHLQPTTFAGAFMFLLYHIVFCLANGSAIIRPNAMDKPILGMMARISTVGIFISAPFYIYRLGSDIPALYPSVDLFLAPFLAQAAVVVDETLTNEYGSNNYPDRVFFSSFAVLTGIGMFLSGCFLRLAATFKLANLGTYLPYSVLCGFFSAVGVLLWALAFSVDTSGTTWKVVFLSGDWDLISNSCLHHLPSLMVGILMNRLGPKNPFFVILLIVATCVCFYIVMWATGTSLEEAQHAKWFWSNAELVYETDPGLGRLESLTLPPAPFSNIWCLFSKDTNWTAVSSGLGNMVALAFLYLLRSSIHASAMKKNVGNLVRRIPLGGDPDVATPNAATTMTSGRAYRMASTIFGSVSGNVRIVQMSLADKKPLRPPVLSEDLVRELPSETNKKTAGGANDEPAYREIRAKGTRRTLEEIFIEYGYALFLVSACGGFANCPTVATSNTMYAIGADGSAPQYGSVLLLILFYFTDFQLVQYIPKTVFSSLLVLGAVDTLVVWFFGSFRKTQDTIEWLVVPLIVLFSLFVGFLNAVFLGIGLSMFVFVASFFRVGVVKFRATGLEIRSRIERSMAQSVWLDTNGDYIQVLVLQNYLFFGNATSILNYIETMFEEVDETQSERLDFSLPPMPTVLVLDLSLISGMDTSTVDIFSDIKELCKNNDCKLYFCGLSPRMRRGFALGGVKPEAGLLRSKRTLRFFADLDTALGQAEDFWIQSEMVAINESTRLSPGESGFLHALKQIDELHGQEFAQGLVDLQSFVVPLELEPGSCLFQSDGGVVQDRGLFFIESGLLKIETDSGRSLTLTRTYSSQVLNTSAVLTLKNQHARMGSLARKAALAKSKSSVHGPAGPQTLRLARIGPGWVCGTLENASGVTPAGVTIAVTRCRLHHLPFPKLAELEENHPFLVLRLYKMLSHLMARREEITIEHLSTLHGIMSSPAHSKAISRNALKALSKVR